MAVSAFSVIIDHEQPRLSYPRICSIAAGLFEPEDTSVRPTVGWSPRWGSTSGGELTTWVDPATGTLMLRPAPMSIGWDTANTGIYARLGKANFTFNDSTKWVEADMAGTGYSKFLQLKDSAAGSSDRTGVTTSTYAKNRGFYVAFFAYSWNDAKSIALKCGWNSSASDASGVSIRVYGGGVCEVLKDGVVIGKGSLVGKREDDAGQSVNNSVVSVVLIPFRKRELLVVSNLGGSFTVLFDDIDEADTDPAITAATNFWFDVPSGAISIEVAPLSYPSSGWRASIPSEKNDAPGGGEVPTFTVLKGANGTVTGSLVLRSDATVTFAPDGVTKSWRVRADLAGDGTYTPFVYAILAEFPPIVEYTSGAYEQDITSYVVDLSIDVPESPEGVRVEFTIKSPDEIDPGNALKLTSLAGRPYKIKYGELDLIEGRLGPPRVKLGIDDATTRVQFEGGDLWQWLETCVFTEEVPLDGLYLHEAVEFLLRSAAIPDSVWTVETSGVLISGPEGAGSRGDWQAKIEVGDTAADWMRKLHESYAATWHYGFYPTAAGIQFLFVSPETLGEISLIELYESIDDVPAATLYPWRFVCRTVDTHDLQPEANRIIVTGLDLRTRRPIQVTYNDFDSQDPTLDPLSRPDNWLGDLAPYGFVSELLTSQSLCEDAADLLAKRLTVQRHFWEIEAELLIDDSTDLPLWRGDALTIGDDVYRVLAVSISVNKDSEAETDPLIESQAFDRPTRYVLEKIVEGTAKGLGGNMLITSISQARALGYALMGVRVTGKGMEKERKRPAKITA